MSLLFELMTRVTDRESFIAFVNALADERAAAAEIERANPEVYMVDGALGWMNGDIESFMGAAVQYFEPTPDHLPEEEPSWRAFAEFLWTGKIIE
jgi:hypothetical protein